VKKYNLTCFTIIYIKYEAKKIKFQNAQYYIKDKRSRANSKETNTSYI
jgi:hypothetical protein